MSQTSHCISFSDVLLLDLESKINWNLYQYDRPYDESIDKDFILYMNIKISNVISDVLNKHFNSLMHQFNVFHNQIESQTQEIEMVIEDHLNNFFEETTQNHSYDEDDNTHMSHSNSNSSFIHVNNVNIPSVSIIFNPSLNRFPTSKQHHIHTHGHASPINREPSKSNSIISHSTIHDVSQCTKSCSQLIKNNNSFIYDDICYPSLTISYSFPSKIMRWNYCTHIP